MTKYPQPRFPNGLPVISRLHRREKGAVIVLVAISLVVLLGMVGLSLDVGQMFIARQQIRAEADAASQAGIMDMFKGTNSSGGHTYGTSYTCSITSSLATTDS